MAEAAENLLVVGGKLEAAVGITVAAGAVGCIVAPPVMGLLFELIPPVLAMAAPAVPLLTGGMLAAVAAPSIVAKWRSVRYTSA